MLTVEHLADEHGEFSLASLRGGPHLTAAMKDGSAWVEYYWYKPGDNVPARKLADLRRVQSGPDIYIVGSGYYTEQGGPRERAQERKKEVAR